MAAIELTSMHGLFTGLSEKYSLLRQLTESDGEVIAGKILLPANLKRPDKEWIAFKTVPRAKYSLQGKR